MIEIPPQLRRERTRFNLLQQKEKKPVENWRDQNYAYNDDKLQSHLKNKGNYGVLCGDGLIVIDADTDELRSIVDARLRPTFTVRTGKGTHYYYWCEGFDNKKVLKRDGEHLGEIQSNGTYVVAPGSVHPNGAVYEVGNDMDIAVVNKQDVDDVFSEYYSSDRIDKSAITDGVSKGNRNDTMFKLACSFKAKGLEHDETLSTIRGLNEKNNPPLPDDEIKQLVRSAYSYKNDTPQDKLKNRKVTNEDVYTSLVLTDDFIAEEILTEKQEVKFCVYDIKNGEITYHSKIEFKGLTYIPIMGEEVIKKAIHLPSCALEYYSDDKLDNELKLHILKWLDTAYDNLQFAIWNIKRSWVFERFHTLNYLRALGDTGQGKSRFLDTYGLLHYKPIATSGATTSAPIFRIIEKWRGTLIMDEADFQKSDEAQDIIKIINMGYERGKFVMRCDQNDANKINFFDPFCPKILATRRSFQDKATESRCITQVMKGTNRKDIPLNLNDEFWNETLILRNKLLMWRFRNYHKIDPNKKIVFDTELEPRVKQIVSSFCSLFTKEYEEQLFKKFVEKHQAEIVEERQNSFDGQIVGAIHKLINENNIIEFDTKDIIDVGDIRDSKGNLFNPRSLSTKLKALGFDKTTPKKIDGKTKRVLPLVQENLDILFKRYGYEVTKVTIDTVSPPEVEKTKNADKNNHLEEISSHRNNRNDRNSVTPDNSRNIDRWYGKKLTKHNLLEFVKRKQPVRVDQVYTHFGGFMDVDPLLDELLKEEIIIENKGIIEVI